MRTLILTLLAATLAAGQSTPRWRVVYEYDQDDTRFSITDFAAPPPVNNESLVIAVGDLWSRQRGRPVAQAVVSRNDGKTWETLKLPGNPTSVFFLTPRLGWFNTGGNIYQTSDGARTWTRLSRLNGALRLHFFDEGLGFAVGLEKSAWRTIDGGRKWTPIKEAAEPSTKKETSAYTVISFRNEKVGVMVGTSVPVPRGPQVPRWIDPDSTSASSRQLPRITMTLATADGGQTWKTSSASIFGQITQWAQSPATAEALTLVEFQDGFTYPSEVHRWTAGKLERTFREKDRAVKDVAIDSLGRGWLAAVEIPGSLNALPIPGKVKMLQSLDLKSWAEVPVDYRAYAMRLLLDVRNSVNPWVATDTGQILRLQ